jgi:hypothetical protein
MAQGYLKLAENWLRRFFVDRMAKISKYLKSGSHFRNISTSRSLGRLCFGIQTSTAIRTETVGKYCF